MVSTPPKCSEVSEQELPVEMDGMEAVLQSISARISRLPGPEGDRLYSSHLHRSERGPWPGAPFASLSPGTQSDVTSLHIPAVLWEADGGRARAPT